MKGFQLIATGGALPGRTVTNEELSRTVDTSDAWITSRTGIRTRHWCTADESAATLAIAAAKQALQRSGLAPADIACCVCATLSAPDATPSVACQVQAALGLPENRPALDVNAACSGFLYGTAVARGLLATLGGQYALVIGCEALSRLMDPADRSTCVLFGDGAGAAIFRLADTPFALTLGARGSDALHVRFPVPAANKFLQGKQIHRWRPFLSPNFRPFQGRRWGCSLSVSRRWSFFEQIRDSTTAKIPKEKQAEKRFFYRSFS